MTPNTAVIPLRKVPCQRCGGIGGAEIGKLKVAGGAVRRRLQTLGYGERCPGAVGRRPAKNEEGIRRIASLLLKPMSSLFANKNFNIETPEYAKSIK